MTWIVQPQSATEEAEPGMDKSILYFEKGVRIYNGSGRIGKSVRGR